MDVLTKELGHQQDDLIYRLVVEMGIVFIYVLPICIVLTTTKQVRKGPLENRFYCTKCTN